MIKLYYHPLSTFSRRAHMALLEKGVAFDLVELDMRKRQHKSPEYLALNPYGRVPTLVEDDFVIYESTAILEYVEATHPSPPLVP
ncbi:MAG TPA: glutathione S-transferase family protein, partial [Minicystis sp.]|nr:glutathione S-transferase family protein [Minicystis sp.]